MTGQIGQRGEAPRTAPRTVPRAALWLGAAGLVPFAAGALLLLAGPETWRGSAEAALIAYGAVILSFMGGCRWGLASAGMGSGPDLPSLAISVVPALYAWVAAMLGGWIAMVLLALGLGTLLAADLALTRRGGAPVWWPSLRWPLTLGAVVSLLAGAAA